MRTPAVILLLLVMLAPRLGAALPHELACAGMNGHAMAPAEERAVTHPHHEAAALSHHHASAEIPAHQQDHQHHHQQAPQSADQQTGQQSDQQTAQQLAQPSEQTDRNDTGNCQHCGDCDDHCSAVLLTALPRLNLLYSPTPLATLIAMQPVSRQNDLNRPPRTALS